MLTPQMSLIHQTPLFPWRHSPMNWQAVITGAESNKSCARQEYTQHAQKHMYIQMGSNPLFWLSSR